MGTDQRKVEALQSLPVISSAPTGVMNTPPALWISLDTASADDDRVHPWKKRAPSWPMASCTLRTALPALPSVSMTLYLSGWPSNCGCSAMARREPMSAYLQ
ncbi:hypothetical protein D9M71_501990 [compost metagenome]